MKIIDVEVHTICPPFGDWCADTLRRYQGADSQYRTIIVVHTDNGIEGLGEIGGLSRSGFDEWTDKLVGSSPWDWVGHRTLPIWFAPAIYDIIGKYNGVPAYRLFGQKVRSRVPVASWTVSQTPAKMAETVQHVAAMGYTWMKYHTNHFHNAVAQTVAMQEVAPPGFKVHYDLNMDSNVEQMMNLAHELEKFPIAGAIEDALRVYDFEGYKVLRQKTRLALYYHHMPLYGRESIWGLTDGYMLGHSPVGEVMSRAGLFEAMNVPFMIQNVGGNITRAFVLHMASVFQTATKHHNSDCETWAEDVVTPMLKVNGGTIRVPEEPGLGLTLDRDALERWSVVIPDPLPRSLIKIRYEGFPATYARLPVQSLSDHTGRGPSFLEGHGPGGYNQPVDQDYWDDDGSTQFATMWEHTESGPVTDD